MKPYVFGVDIGGTTVKLGLFTGEGRLLEKWEIPTRTERGGELVLPDAAALGELWRGGGQGYESAVMITLGTGVGGGVVPEPALRYFRKYAFHVSAHTGAVIARLGNDAGIYGCAKMVLS